jgi:hypothetical protein
VGKGYVAPPVTPKGIPPLPARADGKGAAKTTGNPANTVSPPDGKKTADCGKQPPKDCPQQQPPGDGTKGTEGCNKGDCKTGCKDGKTGCKEGTEGCNKGGCKGGKAGGNSGGDPGTLPGGNTGGNTGGQSDQIVGRHGPYARIDRANEVAAYYRGLGYSAEVKYLGTVDNREYAVDVR